MTATYTFDVFSSLDGYGGVSSGDWGGYWGRQGQELLDHRPSSPAGPATSRSSGVRPTSSCSRAGRWTATSRSSSIARPCTSEPDRARRPADPRARDARHGHAAKLMARQA